MRQTTTKAAALSRSPARRGDSAGGFTLLELTIAILVLVLGVLSMASVLLSTQRQRDLSTSRTSVLDRAVGIMEEIKGGPPESIESVYEGATYTVTGVTGTFTGGAAIQVLVDDTDPKLVTVTVNGSWLERGNTETLSLQTQVYSKNGQF